MAEGRRDGVEVGSTEVRTYVLLFEAAKIALEAARKGDCPPFHHCLQAIVMTAFGLEAYLNHLGPLRFNFWASLRWLRPHEKLAVICSDLGIKPNFGVPPYQAFRQAFSVRDLAAHAETVTVPFERPAGDPGTFPEPAASTLEIECTVSKAVRVFENAMQIVREIHAKAGEKIDPFLAVTHTTWSRPGT